MHEARDTTLPRMAAVDAGQDLYGKPDAVLERPARERSVPGVDEPRRIERLRPEHWPYLAWHREHIWQRQAWRPLPCRSWAIAGLCRSISPS